MVLQQNIDDFITAHEERQEQVLNTSRHSVSDS